MSSYRYYILQWLRILRCARSSTTTSDLLSGSPREENPCEAALDWLKLRNVSKTRRNATRSSKPAKETLPFQGRTRNIMVCTRVRKEGTSRVLPSGARVFCVVHYQARNVHKKNWLLLPEVFSERIRGAMGGGANESFTLTFIMSSTVFNTMRPMIKYSNGVDTTILQILYFTLFRSFGIYLSRGRACIVKSMQDF